MNITIKTNDAAKIMLNMVMKAELNCEGSQCGGKIRKLDVCFNQKSDNELDKEKKKISAANFDDDECRKAKESIPPKSVHFDQIDWGKEEEKHQRGIDFRQERLRRRRQKKERKQRAKLLTEKKENHRHEEYCRLNETLLYILLCDVDLLLCQYQNEALKNVFDDIFTSTETPETRFPCVRFLMLRSRLKELIKVSKEFLSSQVKTTLLHYNRKSPVFSCAMKEMSSFHALCHLKNINLQALFLGDDRDSDHRVLISCIHKLIDEILRPVIVSKRCTKTFRCGCDANLCHFGGETLCYNVDFHSVTHISREANNILFLMSTLPAFLDLTETNEIRQRETMLLIST